MRYTYPLYFKTFKATYLRLYMIFAFCGLCMAQAWAGGTLSNEPCFSGRNIALVIGTDKYQSDHWKPLNNPVLDATDIATILQNEYGYEVTLLTNPTRIQILDALAQLKKDFASSKIW